MSLADTILRLGALTVASPPLAVARGLGSGLGVFCHMLDKRHREIARANLAASFPQKDQAWVEKTARGVYAHLGKVGLEIPRLLRLSLPQITRRTRIHGAENYRWVQAQGKGALFLSGHIGNWEWGSLAGTDIIGPSVLIARPIDWPPAERLVMSWRTSTGHTVLPKANSARGVLRALKQNRMVGVLLDQNVDWYDGEWVDFFGRPACTNKGLALLARKTGTPVLPFHNFRADDGCFDVYIGEPIPLVKTSDKIQDTWDNTQAYTKALEDIIRQKPEQWFWLHQRWKTKPYHNWPREQS